MNNIASSQPEGQESCENNKVSADEAAISTGAAANSSAPNNHLSNPRNSKNESSEVPGTAPASEAGNNLQSDQSLKELPSRILDHNREAEDKLQIESLGNAKILETENV